MNKLMIAAVMAFSVTAVIANEEDPGMVIKKGTYTGKILLVDTQKSLAFEKIQGTAKFLADQTKMNISAIQHAPGCPAELQKELGANVLITVIDDPKKTAMLLAPEDHWGVVNVARLVDDLPGENAKKRFRDPRAHKEIIRAFSLLCGGGGSQFRGNMMNAATMKEVDRSVDTIPVDMIDFWETYLKAFGVTKKELVSYEEACEGGYAPNPTNDAQKAIWDTIHAPPSNPIKIEFDPAKGR